MDMKGALRARLLAAPVADMLWLNPETGKRAVHWLKRPQGGGLPAITLEQVTGARPRTYSGLQGTTSPRIQLNVWAEAYDEAQDILDAAVAALTPRETSNDVFFDNIEFEGEGDSLERLGTTDIIHKRIDLIVWHHPA